MKPETKYVILLTSLYFVASLVGVLHHELWLDESHHWLLSRDSTSLANLIENTRYEGHPILWNIILYGITRWTLNPLWMQLLHIAIATIAMNFFMRKAPFPLLFKVLFIFGYFMFFEYNLISRNYILGVLLLFIVCSLFGERKKHFILFSICLALLANIHLMFGLIAFALFLTVLLENIQDKTLFSKSSYPIGYLIFICGVVLLSVQVIPPDDTSFFIRVNDIPLSEKFTKGFIALFKGLATVPDFSTIHFWNSNWLVNLSKPVTAVLGLLGYLLPLFLFRKKATLFFVYAALIGVQIFFYTVQLGATRYDGITYLILIAALWIDPDLPDGKLKWPIPNFRKPIVYGILLIHFCSGIGAYITDYKYPFTTAKEVVDYLKEKKLDSAPVVTVTCDGTLFSSFLGKKVWFLCDQHEESYCHWNRYCTTDISTDMVVSMLSGYMQNHDYAVFVSYYPILDNAPHGWTKVNGIFKVRFHKRSGESIIRKNSLYIYEVAKINHAEQ